MPKKRVKDEADKETPQGAGLSPPVDTTRTQGAGSAGGDDPEPSRQLQNGRTSIDWLRWAYRQNTRLMMDVTLGKQDMPRGYNPAQVRDLLDAECKASGLDPKHLADTRTDAQINQDTAESLLKSPDEMWSALDSFIDEMKRQMDNGDNFCGELVGAPGTDAANLKELAMTREEVSARQDAKKKWSERLRKIKVLRDRARNPVPTGQINNFNAVALAIAHPLRFMVYTCRPGGSTNKCCLIGMHHAKMALTLYSLKHGKIYQSGIWRDYNASGALMVAPPGHNKTTILVCSLVLELDFNPRLRIIMLHAQADQSEKNLAYLCTFFQPSEAAGRRNLSLFPGNRIIQQNASTMRLFLPEKQRQATVVACGVNAKENGSDADILAGDDICDQQIAEQDTERNRVFDRMNGTWRRRLRDGKTREILTTTLWHHDDPHCRMIRLGKEGKIKYLFCIQECGGPDQNFKPLWPEAYPAAKLRAIYGEMRNARLYAAAYQSNPQPEELRKIKKLKYYLPGDDQHADFMASATTYLSMDPSATNTDTSDRASFCYAALGDVASIQGNEYSSVRKLRFVDAKQFKANQSEGVEEVCSFSESRSVSYLIVETRGGFNATAEILESRGLDVIRFDPKNRKKSQRLDDVSNMLDDSLADRGFPSAVIEFPGMRLDDGSIGRDPDSPLKWLEDQILDFGVVAEDHGVDAVTQLAKYLGPQLNVGTGAVTSILQEQSRARAANPRLAEAVGRLFGRGQKGENSSAELSRWASENL